MPAAHIDALRALLPDGADAEKTLDRAVDAAFLVRDRVVSDDLLALAQEDPVQVSALVIALAAFVDIDSRPEDLLQWLCTHVGRERETTRMLGALAEARREYDEAAADTLPEVTLDSMREMAHAARLAGVLQPCGTIAGHTRHIKAKQKACVRCVRARSIWDTATPEQRQRIKTPPSRSSLPIPCGTVQGFDWHRQFDEKPCKMCLQAAADVVYQTVVAGTTKSGKNPPVLRPICGDYRGYNMHGYYDEEPCDPCRQARSRFDAERSSRRKGTPAGKAATRPDTAAA